MDTKKQLFSKTLSPRCSNFKLVTNIKHKKVFTRFHIPPNGTTIEIGPGRYDDCRTSFPRIDKHGKILPKDFCKQKSSFNFKSQSPRLQPLFLSDAPSPGKYECKSLAQMVCPKRKNIFNSRSSTLLQKINTETKSSPSKKSMQSSPGPGHYKLNDSFESLMEINKKSRKPNAIFASKTLRHFILENNMPPVGSYKEDNLTIAEGVNSQLKKIPKPSQNTVAQLAFESTSDRFRQAIESEVGPGKYSSTSNSNQKCKLVNSTTKRFACTDNGLKFPGPGSYKISDPWCRIEFSVITKK